MWRKRISTPLCLLLLVLMLCSLPGPSEGATKVSLKDLSYGEYGARYIHLDWTESGDWAFDNYEVYMKDKPDEEWQKIVRIKEKGITHYNITGLKPFTAYWFKVRDCDSFGCQDSDVLTEITARLDSVHLYAPSIDDVRATSVYLHWTVDFTNSHIGQYHVFEKNDTGSEDPRVTPYGEYTVKGLSPNTTYCFWVVVENDLGEFSDNSNEVCVTTRLTTEGGKGGLDDFWFWVAIVAVVIITLLIGKLLYDRYERRVP